MGWSTVQMDSGLKWKRIGTQRGLSSKLIKSTCTINRFIDFRYNSDSAGKLLNYALNIQSGTLIIFIFNQHHQEYRDLDQLICWFTRILLLRIDPRFNDLQNTYEDEKEDETTVLDDEVLKDQCGAVLYSLERWYEEMGFSQRIQT
ncbi:hypothetical protein HZH66_014679 [Vespula vulgaris]|uniref:Uncharacterized protein n=1 Tax=Vespula vulgaris TaxID=7454 RepID=A0A834MQL2_VESVU|nr:hypothetical protein HZH66_014679 [Vespula vulgaris]